MGNKPLAAPFLSQTYVYLSTVFYIKGQFES